MFKVNKRNELVMTRTRTRVLALVRTSPARTHVGNRVTEFRANDTSVVEVPIDRTSRVAYVSSAYSLRLHQAQQQDRTTRKKIKSRRNWS